MNPSPTNMAWDYAGTRMGSITYYELVICHNPTSSRRETQEVARRNFRRSLSRLRVDGSCKMHQRSRVEGRTKAMAKREDCSRSRPGWRIGAVPIIMDQIFSGLAWSLISGLFASTLFALFVIPVASWLHRAK
jgi:hypothetical protein